MIFLSLFLYIDMLHSFGICSSLQFLKIIFGEIWLPWSPYFKISRLTTLGFSDLIYIFLLFISVYSWLCHQFPLFFVLYILGVSLYCSLFSCNNAEFRTFLFFFSCSTWITFHICADLLYSIVLSISSQSLVHCFLNFYSDFYLIFSIIKFNFEIIWFIICLITSIM